MRISIGCHCELILGVGSWYDNAPMESFFGTLKSELVHHRVYHTRDWATPDWFFYIKAFYNRRRLCQRSGRRLFPLSTLGIASLRSQ